MTMTMVMMNKALMIMLMIICAAGQNARGMSAVDWKLMKFILMKGNNIEDNDHDHDYDDDDHDDFEDDVNVEEDFDAHHTTAAVTRKLPKFISIFGNWWSFWLLAIMNDSDVWLIMMILMIWTWWCGSWLL